MMEEGIVEIPDDSEKEMQYGKMGLKEKWLKIKLNKKIMRFRWSLQELGNKE